MRGLIGETWRLVRSHARPMLLVALVFLVPAELAVAYAWEDDETVGLLARLALYLIGYAWVVGALLLVLDNRARRALEPYGRIVDRVPALALANLVAGIGIGIGLVLLVLPGLLIAARWMAVAPLIALERQGPIQAFEASNDLVRGRTWAVVGAILLAFFVAFLAAIPGLVVVELAESTWARGLGEVLIDIPLFLSIPALTYVVYRRTRAT